jgi:hypothetical protein
MCCCVQQPAAAYAVDNSAVSGQRVRAVIYPTDDFTQAGDRYRWFDPARQVYILIAPYLR